MSFLIQHILIADADNHLARHIPITHCSYDISWKLNDAAFGVNKYLLGEETHVSCACVQTPEERCTRADECIMKTPHPRF